MRLNEALEGQPVVVESFDPALDKNRRRRFEDLGLFPGVLVSRKNKAPLGDPIAYLVRGTVLCLRGEEASKIIVKAAA